MKPTNLVAASPPTKLVRKVSLVDNFDVMEREILAPVSAPALVRQLYKTAVSVSKECCSLLRQFPGTVYDQLNRKFFLNSVSTNMKVTPVQTDRLVAATSSMPIRSPLVRKPSEDYPFDLEYMGMRDLILSGPFLLRYYIETTDANAAVSFYKRAFGAEEFHLGMLGDFEDEVSAELSVGGMQFQINICEREKLEAPDKCRCGPALLVDDVDEAIAKAKKAGAVAVGEIKDIGVERKGKVKDPFNVIWYLISPAHNPPLEVLLTLQEVVNRPLYTSDGSSAI